MKGERKIVDKWVLPSSLWTGVPSANFVHVPKHVPCHLDCDRKEAPKTLLIVPYV
jgi:hypothetical protein